MNRVAVRVAITVLAVALGVGGLALLEGGRARADHAPGGIYHGTTTNDGDITIWLSAAGDRLIGVQVRFPANSTCPGVRTVALDVPLTNHQFNAVVPTSNDLQSITFVGGFTTPDRVGRGTLFWTGTTGGACRAGNVIWGAPPSTSIGAFTAGELPRGGGFGIMVYGGGAANTVVFASTSGGCSSPALTFWASEGGRFIQYVPGAQVAAVNEGWFARFRDGIPPGTAMIVRCVLATS